MVEFKLPDVGEGIHEAEIVQWLVQVGDSVSQDQPMVEIQTDKAVVEIPAPAAGKIAEIRAGAGTMAHVGDILVVIEAEPQSNPQPVAAEPPPDQQPREVQPPLAAPKMGIAGAGQRVLAAPAVRRLAMELGIDLAEVPGSGPAGRVLPGDVRQFEQRLKKAAAPPPTP